MITADTISKAYYVFFEGSKMQHFCRILSAHWSSSVL